MGFTESEEPTDEEQAAYEVAQRLLRRQRMRAQAEREFIGFIIELKDKYGWTFLEIGELADIAHSWIFKLYRRGKREGIK